MGRDMWTSHAGLQITESEWEASIELIRKALQNYSVAPREQVEFLGLVEQSLVIKIA